MKLRNKLNRRNLSILIVMAACLCAALVVVVQPGWMPYAPSPVLANGIAALEQIEQDQPVQMAFVPENDPTMQLYAFDSFGRSALASRGFLSWSGYDARAFRDQLASHEIELKSGPDELANVELASEAIDGRMVAPYEVFSFNQAVGERSLDRGFRLGLMFSSGEVVTGVGGGVCIVSTALYNTAVRAGYQIVERSPHSGPVRYSEPGLDAAVVFGCLDMRFKNNTPYPMLIRSSVSNDRLVVSLYGRKQQGMEVALVREDYKELPYKVFEKEDPTIPEGTVEVKTPARTGFEVAMVRVFRLNGVEIRRETLSHDRVAPRNKVVLIPVRSKAPALDAPTAQASEPEQLPRTEGEHQASAQSSESNPPAWTLPTKDQEPELDVKLRFNPQSTIANQK